MWTDDFDKATLEKKIETLTYLKSDIEKGLEELNNALKAREEEEKNKWWTPKVGEEYYYIKADGHDGHISTTNNDDFPMDNDNIKLGNAFKTKEEAERKLFELTLHHKLEKFAYENNDREIEWDDNSSKYYIYYDYSMKIIRADSIFASKYYGQVYFSSKEIAEKAIGTFKDDLTRYFTSDK